MAVVAIVFLFLPLGVLALVFSLRSRSQWSAGDAAGAAKSARLALTFVIAALVVQVVLMILSALGTAVWSGMDSFLWAWLR